MAYDALASKKRTQQAPSQGNPYASLTSPTGTVMPEMGTAAPQGTVTAMTGQYAAPLGNSSGPSATGHVNFDSLYNANASVATREANSRADSAQSAARGAQNELTGAQNQFNNAVNAGSVRAPDANSVARASGGGTKFYDQMAQRQNGSAAPAGMSAVAGQKPVTTNSANPMTADTSTNYRNWLGTNAQAGYTGPTAMSAMDQYGKLSTDTASAQDQINNPATGMNKTDAALINAAGRPRFSQLQSQYGNLGSNLNAANKASQDQADQASKDSEAARLQYEALANQYDANQQQGSAAPGPTTISAAPGVGNSPTSIGTTPDAQSQFGANDDFTNWLHSDNYNTMLKNMGASEDDTVAAQKQAGVTITPSEWLQVRGMTPDQQKAWWADWKKKHGVT